MKKEKKSTDGWTFGLKVLSGIISGNIERAFDNVKTKAHKNIEEIKDEAIKLAYSFKKSIFRSTIELFFIITALVSLLIGFLLYLSRYFVIDKILLVYGIVVVIISLFIVRLK